MPVAAVVAPPRLVGRRSVSAAERCSRRLGLIWGLLFLNVLGYLKSGSPILPLPWRFGQVITQGSLVLAFVLTLSINPRLRVRPNLYLGLLTLLGVSSFAMSIRVGGLGTDYRAVRLALFIAVLWLLTPWWGRPDMILVRSQMRFLVLILISVGIGLVIAPTRAYYRSRLTDALWPVGATQLAHYAAALAGLGVVLWMSRLLTRNQALFVVIPSTVALVATHTRTASVSLLAGLAVGGLSLFTAHRRVRKVFVATTVVVMVGVIPLSPLLTSWVERGQTPTQLQELTGRAKVWPTVFSEPKPLVSKVLGSGLSNGSVIGALNPAGNGNPIDSGWVASYQDQGYMGWALEGAMFLVLLVTALLRPPDAARGMALFLIVYCFVASFTESGLGEASSYMLDLSLAAAVLAQVRHPGHWPVSLRLRNRRPGRLHRF